MPLDFHLPAIAVQIALGTLAVLSGAAVLLRCCRQPADRIGIIAWAFAACLLLPLLVCLPGVPRLAVPYFDRPADTTHGDVAASRPTPSAKASLPSATSDAPAVNSLDETPILRQPQQAEFQYENGVSPIRESSASGYDGARVELRHLLWLVIAVYLVAVAFFASKWLTGLFKLRRFYRTTRPSPSWIKERLANLAGPAARNLDLRISSQIDAPLTWGVIRPVIVLPASLVDDDESLLYCLAHEWSHVERKDWLVTAIAGMVETVAFYQPLFWWLRRQLVLCQDYLADARAAELAPSNDDYAEFLVALGKRRLSPASLPALGMGSRRSRLFHRVAMLVESRSQLRRKPLARWNFAAAATALALAVMVSSVSLQARATAAVDEAPESDAQQSQEGKDAENKPAQADPAQKPLPDPITYTGKVTDRQTGAPIEGATVFIERSLSRDPKTQRQRTLETTEHVSDREGTYQFTLPPEQVAEPSLYLQVDAKHPDYASKGKSGYSHAMIQKNLELGEEPFYSQIKLFPGKSVTGVVTNPAGGPLAGAKIMAYTKAPSGGALSFEFGAFQETTTDDEGRFSLVVHTPGDGVFWVSHDEYASQAHRLFDRRGDWGALALGEGTRVSGKLLSAKGEPVAGVELSISRNGDGEEADEFLGQNAVSNGIRRSTTSDEKGDFRFGPMPPGGYRLEISQREQDWNDHVFLGKRIEITDAGELAPLEVRAEPPVYIRATYLDGKGKPRTGHAIHLFGRLNEDFFFAQSTPAGEDGKLQLAAPHGLEEIEVRLMTNEHSALRWRMGPDKPLQNGSSIKFERLEDDVTGIEIVRYQAPILLVKAVDIKGEPVGEFKPKLVYKENSPKEPGSMFVSGVDGDVYFEKQQDGRWRSSQLLPDQEFTVTAEMEGHTTKEESLTLTEGETREMVFSMEASGAESPKDE